MPMYDYKCPSCGVIREVKVGINERPSLYHCGGVLMIKQISIPPSVHFKGSGFYETDYKGK